MSPFVQLKRCRKTGWATADDCDLFPGTHLRRACFYKAGCIGIFNDRTLIRLRRHRITIQIACAGCLAQSRADTRCKFREAMCLRQSPICLLPVTMVHQIVALRHQIVQRAAGGHASDHHARLAERYTARHAPCALQALLFQRKRNMKFIKVLNSFLRCDFQVVFSFVV